MNIYQTFGSTSILKYQRNTLTFWKKIAVSFSCWKPNEKINTILIHVQQIWTTACRLIVELSIKTAESKPGSEFIRMNQMRYNVLNGQLFSYTLYKTPEWYKFPCLTLSNKVNNQNKHPGSKDLSITTKSLHFLTLIIDTNSFTHINILPLSAVTLD